MYQLPSNLVKYLINGVEEGSTEGYVSFKVGDLSERGGAEVINRFIGELKTEYDEKKKWVLMHRFWSLEKKQRLIDKYSKEFTYLMGQYCRLFKIFCSVFGFEVGSKLFEKIIEKECKPKLVRSVNGKFYYVWHFQKYVDKKLVLKLIVVKKTRLGMFLVFTVSESYFKRMRSKIKKKVLIPCNVKEQKRWILQIVLEELQVGYYRNFRDVQMDISSKYGLDLSIKFIRYCYGYLFRWKPPPKPPRPVHIGRFFKPFDPGDLLWQERKNG